MSDLNFFDCNCQIGRRATKGPREFCELSELLDQMEYYSIKEALVCHSVSVEYNPTLGNSMLLDEIKSHKNLHGIWVLIPGEVRDTEEPEAIMEEMLKDDIYIAKIYPKTHGFILDDFYCGKLLSALEKRRIPLFIDHEEFCLIDRNVNGTGEEWERIREICQKHPDLPLVITNIPFWSRFRYLDPLFEAFENLYIETSLYNIHIGIEYVCEKFGARRLLFGTNMPIFSAGGALSTLLYADISDEEKRMIAGDNLRRLIGEIKGDERK